jgi:amicyanin
MSDHHNNRFKSRTRKVFSPLLTGALLVIGALVLAACGAAGGKSGGGDGNMAGMNMAAPPVAKVGSTTPVASNAVQIKKFAFSPATVTVKAGSTVVWTNSDPVQHDITFDSGGIASSVLNHNDTFSHTFQAAGTYHYICSIHPFMHGTVIVTE